MSCVLVASYLIAHDDLECEQIQVRLLLVRKEIWYSIERKKIKTRAD